MNPTKYNISMTHLKSSTLWIFHYFKVHFKTNKFDNLVTNTSFSDFKNKLLIKYPDFVQCLTTTIKIASDVSENEFKQRDFLEPLFIHLVTYFKLNIIDLTKKCNHTILHKINESLETFVFLQIKIVLPLPTVTY
jgi:hypothetical protein